MARSPRRHTQRVTMAQVAAAAGCSTMTVSRVIRNDPTVNEPARVLIRALIREMGFTPNAAAQGLASAKAIRIGLLYDNPRGAYLSAFLIEMLDEISGGPHQLVLQRCSAGADRSGAKAAVQRLLEQSVDGVILTPPLCDDEVVLDLLEAAAKPVMAVSTARTDDRTLVVAIDDFEAARAMTEHLIGLGHERIGLITGDRAQSASIRRREGFVAALQAAGRRSDLIAEGDYSVRTGLEGAFTLLGWPDAPTAIFASNDDMASGVMAAAHRMGLMVPENLSVAGFDDTLIATTTWPELTTIRQPIAAIARNAIDLLVREVRQQDGEGGLRRVLLPHELIARRSTFIPQTI